MQLHRLTATPLDVGALAVELGFDAAFPPEALAAARRAAERPLPDLPDSRDVPLVTIDPIGSRDLDQAVAIETRQGGGWVVHYAIADVGAFIDPHGPLDLETRRRGETLYAPDRRIPLHPDVLGEGAASLLPDVDRPAILWRIEVGSDGTPGAVDVRRALVRSRARLDYAGVQRAHEAGTLPEPIVALGAIELNLPEQRVEARDDGWSLTYRSPLPVEVWNAQVSLLTGSVAARMMIDGGVGLLRTLPQAAASTVERLRRAAPGLGVDWPAAASPGQVIASLELADPRHVAFADLAAELLRGAGYVSFDGTTARPEWTCRCGRCVRPRHRTDPPPRRPVRQRGLCRARRRGRGPRLGA